MDEAVIKLVKELAEYVRKHTKGKHPDVTEAMKSVQDYVTEATVSKSVFEDKLKQLEDKLSDKKLLKKPCKDLTERIRQAMRVQRPTEKKETHSKDKKRSKSSGTKNVGITPSQTNYMDANTNSPKYASKKPPKKTSSASATLGQHNNTEVLYSEGSEMSSSREINQFKTEKLRKTLAELHHDVVGDDGTQLKRMKTTTGMGDDQFFEVCEDIINEVRQKFQDTKSDAENAIKGRNCLLQVLKFLLKHIRDESEGKAQEDTSTTLDHLKSSIDTDSSANEGLSHAKEILTIQLDWKRLRSDLEKKKELVNKLTLNLKRIEDENTRFRIETDELRTRLSENAGLLITHGNPAITDLSDPNRPTKLAEKYSEIYDNQWTDAFENISKSKPKTSEKDLVGHLHGMLLDCYGFCEEARRKQKLALEFRLFNPHESSQPSQKRENGDINKLLDKSLSDAVKLSGSVTSANIAQAFVKERQDKKTYGKLMKLCDTYLQECVQLCWLMQVQTPPLRIDLKTLPGQPFDKNCYREYTKIGEKVAFVVWPALFLHENGPTLYKGIAQGQ